MLSTKDLMYRIEKSKADIIFGDESVMEKIPKSCSIPWKILVEETKEKELKNIK